MRIVKEDSTHAEGVRSRLKKQIRLSHLTAVFWDDEKLVIKFVRESFEIKS